MNPPFSPIFLFFADLEPGLNGRGTLISQKWHFEGPWAAPGAGRTQGARQEHPRVHRGDILGIARPDRSEMGQTVNTAVCGCRPTSPSSTATLELLVWLLGSAQSSELQWGSSGALLLGPVATHGPFVHPKYDMSASLTKAAALSCWSAPLVSSAPWMIASVGMDRGCGGGAGLRVRVPWVIYEYQGVPSCVIPP